MNFNRVAASVFAVVAVAHGYRAIQQIPIQVGSLAIPEWVSFVGAAAAAVLSIWGFRSRA